MMRADNKWRLGQNLRAVRAWLSGASRLMRPRKQRDASKREAFAATSHLPDAGAIVPVAVVSHVTCDAEFDAFIAGIIAAFHRANDRLRQRAMGHLMPLVELDSEGGPAIVTLSTGDGFRRIPLLSLAKIKFSTIREMTVELDCGVENVRELGEGHITLRASPQQSVHRVRLNLKGGDAAGGFVSVDDEIIRTWQGFEEVSGGKEV